MNTSPPSCNFKTPSGKTGADNFAGVRHIHKKIGNLAGGAAKFRIARTRHADAVKQAHAAIHLQAKVGDVGGGNCFEKVNQRVADVIGQLQRGLFLPAGGNFFEMQRREFALDFVFESKIEVRRLVGFAMAQNGFRFARIVVAVVKEENNFAADFFLQPPRGLDFGNEKSFRKKSARLLAKTDDGCAAHAVAARCRFCRASTA